MNVSQNKISGNHISENQVSKDHVSGNHKDDLDIQPTFATMLVSGDHVSVNHISGDLVSGNTKIFFNQKLHWIHANLGILHITYRFL